MENPNKTLFECQQMFRHACAFSDCADFANEKFCHETADIERYTIPSIVNSAFACEVYLKALLLYHGIPYKKLLKSKKWHETKELYGVLPDNLKDRIRLTVMNNYGGIWEDAFGYDLLDNISNAFLDWRYIYEGKETRNGKRIKRASHHIDISFLTVFRNTLREACCQLFFSKMWEEYVR